MSSGERKRKSPNLSCLQFRGKGLKNWLYLWRRTVWEDRPKKVRVLYSSKYNKLVSRVMPATWNLAWTSGDHPIRLNTTWWPIEISTVRERWKEPREGSEIEHETLCLQTDKARYMFAKQWIVCLERRNFIVIQGGRSSHADAWQWWERRRTIKEQVIDVQIIAWRTCRCDVVLFVERSSELMYMARLSTKNKVRSRSESESEEGEISHIY